VSFAFAIAALLGGKPDATWAAADRLPARWHFVSYAWAILAWVKRLGLYTSEAGMLVFLGPSVENRLVQCPEVAGQPALMHSLA